MEDLFRNVNSPGTDASQYETIVTSAAIGVAEGEAQVDPLRHELWS